MPWANVWKWRGGGRKPGWLTGRKGGHVGSSEACPYSEPPIPAQGNFSRLCPSRGLPSACSSPAGTVSLLHLLFQDFTPSALHRGLFISAQIPTHCLFRGEPYASVVLLAGRRRGGSLPLGEVGGLRGGSTSEQGGGQGSCCPGTLGWKTAQDGRSGPRAGRRGWPPSSIPLSFPRFLCSSSECC